LKTRIRCRNRIHVFVHNDINSLPIAIRH
jgi:hypothetical protein